MNAPALTTTILDAAIEFIPRRLASPLVLSSGRIDEVTEARATVRVRVNGQEESGRGAVYLSDLWAWPDSAVPHPERDRRLRSLCRNVAANLNALCGGEAAHPLELGMRLHETVGQLGLPAATAQGIPVLARLLCASSFDAALHDATGLATGRSAFSFYDDPCDLPSANRWFEEGDARRAIRQLLNSPPRRAFPACFVIGPNDPLDRHIRHWTVERGYRRVKLKLSGRDAVADTERTVAVVRALIDSGVARPWVSIDTNEASPDAASVEEYLRRLAIADARALEAIQYLEQPTARDLVTHPQDWRGVTRLKPVLLDEGLTGLALLDEARRQGWSGCALKTCKGHSFCLVTAAWAHRHGWQITLQDLTNPGYAAIHAALFAAHVPTLNGLELNSPQFTPEANVPWLPRLAPLLEPVDGFHRVEFVSAEGLGSRV